MEVTMMINLIILGFVGLCILTAFEAAKENEYLVQLYEEEEKGNDIIR